MQDVRRIGYTQLLGADGARDRPYRVNIIFVHGLRGHPRETWEDRRGGSNDVGNATPSKRKSSKKPFFKLNSSASTVHNRTSEDRSRKLFWPDEYLTEDVPEARVWTYGYNADTIAGLFEANNKNSVSQHGRDLCVKTEREIENEDPILWVAHSLGGVIVKDAIRRSTVCRERTKLIVFLGTPHRGSLCAGWGGIAANLAGLVLQGSNKKIIETLEVNSEVLGNIHEEFITIVHESGIKIHSFQEAKGISGMKGLDNKVVDDFSSKLELPGSLETVESIDANHMQMARCNDRADPRYLATVGVLKQFMRSSVHDKVRLKRDPSIAATMTIAVRPGEATRIRTNSTCHYIPFPENRRFVGREKTLNQLEQMLSVESESQRAAVVGLGGVGKTQVALKFAYWVKVNKLEHSTFWVPASSRASFEQAYIEMARSLPIPKVSEDKDPKESVRRYLSSEAAGPWLLVVDNADDIDMLFKSSDALGGISQHLPEREGCLILFTTRSREVAISVAGCDVIELQEMDPKEATSLLEKSLIRKDLLHDETAATELLRELTYLPLAITQAAAYLNRNQEPIGQYLRLLRGTERDIVGLMSREFYDNTRYNGSQNAVATTWLVSFDQIRQIDHAAADLLSFMSQIEPKAIPQRLLPRLRSEEQMVHAIGTLRGYAFVSKRDDQLLDMHRLVQIAMRIWLTKEGLVMQTIERVMRHLTENFPSIDYENRDTWRQYLPHAFQIIQRTKAGDIEERYELQFWVGSCLAVEGRIKEAVICLEECSQWWESQLPEDHPLLVASQHALAAAYRADGQTRNAIELQKHVVAIKEKSPSEPHTSLLASQHELARAFSADGQINDAVVLLEHVVAVKKGTLKKDHPSLLASQHELAGAYCNGGKTKEAVTLLEHVVEVKKQTLTQDHPLLLTSEHTLAGAYLSDQQVGKAVELLEYVVAVRRRTLAEDDSSLLLSQRALTYALEIANQHNS